MSIYDDLFNILKSANIKKLSDLYQLDKLSNYRAIKCLSSFDYPWVKDIFDLYCNIYTSILKALRHSDSPIFINEPLYFPFGAKTWDIGDRIFDLRAKYSCLFPKRILTKSYQFIQDEGVRGGKTDFLVPIDFLLHAFALMPALKTDLAHLIPSRIAYNDPFGTTGTVGDVNDTWQFVKSNQVINIPGVGYGYDHLVEFSKEQHVDLLENQILAMPWLANARMEDFVDLVTENKEDFDLYLNCINNFLSTESHSAEMIKDWVAKVSYESQKLDIIFKKKQKDLNKKGTTVAVGLVFSIFSLLLPESLGAIKHALAAIFSSKTVYDGFQWLHSAKNSKVLLSENEFWVLWMLKGYNDK